jgi:hypothetical protein
MTVRHESDSVSRLFNLWATIASMALTPPLDTVTERGKTTANYQTWQASADSRTIAVLLRLCERY